MLNQFNQAKFTSGVHVSLSPWAFDGLQGLDSSPISL